MLISSFFSWWYGDGWRQVLQSLNIRISSVFEFFSVKQLFRSLFEPWKQIISYSGVGIDSKFRAMADNFFSRTVGFVVRSLVLLTAMLATLVICLLTIVEMVLWPLLPLCIPAGLILGFVL
jgi:hypothetical protein